MMNLFTNKHAKTISVTLRAYVFIASMLLISIGVSTESQANCSGCNFTITTNASYTIPAGQTYCLQYSNYTGTITFGAGSVLCIGSGITWSAISANLTGATGTINNYGTGSESFTLPSGYTFNNYNTYSGTLTQSAGSTVINSGTFSGNLIQNGGTFTNNSGATLSGTSSISGTLTNNGTINNTITINNGGIVTNTASLSANITMAAGSTFTNSSTYSGTMTNNGGTINNTGTISNTFTLNGTLNNNSGGTLSNGVTVANGATVSNSGTISNTLTINSGGTVTNNSGGTISATSSITGTLTNNGNITNNITINNGGVFTNNYATLTATISSMASGATFNNTGTYSGSISSSSGSTITNSGTMTITGGTIAGAFTTTSGSTTTNSNGNITGTATIGGTMANNATMSGTTTISATGTMTTGSNLSGTVIVNGTFTVNSGASPSIGSVTVNSGGIVNNNGTIQNGSFTANAGSTVNNYGILHENTAISISGTLNNYSGANIQSALTGNAGSTITNYSGAQITAPTTIAGTLNNNSGGTISNPVTENAGGTITNAGSMSAGATVNGGTFNETSTGTITNGGTYNITVNGGSVTLNSSISNVEVTGGSLTNTATIGGQINVTGGTVTNTGTISGSYTQSGGTVNNGSGGLIDPSSLHLTAGTDSLTNNSGGTITFPSGTNTLPNGYVLTNYGTFNTSSPLTISAGATANLEGTENMSSSTVSNSGTINLAGSLTVSTYSGAGALNEISAGCNTFTTSSNTGTGTFNGGQSTHGGGLIVNSYSGSSTYSNGASASVIAPTQQPTGFTGTLSVLTVSGGFTSPSASITGYIVLRYIGVSAPSCSPTNNTLYTVGNTVGSCTVAAIVAGGSAGVKTFTDNIPGGDCGENVYYEIYSYNGPGECVTYDLTSPLTGTVAIPSFTTSISPAGPSTFCGSGTLTASGVGTYLWNATGGSATTAAITASASGTYAVTVTNAQSCTASASNVVTVNTIPTAVAVSGAGTFCGSATLTATGGTGGTIYWENTTSNGTSTATPSASQVVSASGTYYFRADNACGWGTQGSAAVTINANPTVAAITGTTAVCAGSTTTLSDATLGGTWSSSNTGVATVLLGIVTGVSAGTDTISYTVTNILTGCSTTVTAIVTVNPLPIASITPAGPSTFCGSGTLTASGVGTYLWNATGGSATTAAITASASGIYVVTVTNSSSCTASASNVVTINPIPAAPTAATATPASICVGATSQLKATSAGNTIRWWTAATGGTMLGTSASGANYAVTPGSTATYYAEAYTAAGCASATRVAVTVTVNPLPTAAITPAGPSTFCGSGTLTASGGGTYLWNATGGSATTAAITASASGTYVVTVTSALSCTASASSAVTINPIPAAPTAVTATAASICAGGTSQLNATSAGNTIRWWTAATGGSMLGTSASGANYAVTPGSTTTYYAESYTATGCASATRVAVTVTVNPLPTSPTSVTATSASICAGQTSQLNATSAGNTINWWTAATGGTLLGTSASGVNYAVTPGTTTTYYAEAYTAAGCASASRVAVTVTVNPLPTPSVDNAVSCSGASVTLTVGGGTSYLWSTGATTTTISAGAGIYTVTATLGTCTASVSDTVKAIANPTLTVNNPATCAGGYDTLKVTGGGSGATYLWSNGVTVDSVITTTAGVYHVTVTNSSGCSATASGIATVNAIPTPYVDSPSICAGSIATLTATGGVIYQWSTGATTSTITTATAGAYTVTATSIGGCTASAVGIVTIVANPSLSTTNGVICSGSPATLTATSSGSTFVWSTGATTASISTTTPGTYSVTATSALGCNTSATASATTSTNPTPTVNSPTICAGASTTLTAIGGATYIWSTAATTASISVTPASTTTYTVTASNAAGCSATASGTVTVNALPTPSVNNGVVCSGASATLTATGGTSYHWSTGATTASITTAVIGTYTVTVTNAATCTATASGTVTVAVAPIATVNSLSACSAINSTLTATITAGGPCTYLWSTGATTASITVAPTATTTYGVTVTNASGCTASASGTVTVYPMPSITAGSNSPILFGATITLTSTVSGGTTPYASYAWSGPSSFSSAVANPTIASATAANGGLYYVTVTDHNGCTANNNTEVLFNSTAPGGVSSYNVLWLRSNSLALANGASVSSWINNTGSGNNLTQATAAAQPTYYNNSANYINYYPVVSFNGTSDQMTAASFSGTGTFSQADIYFVGKASNNSQSGFVLYEPQATYDGESGRIGLSVPWGGTNYWDAGSCCTNNRLTSNFPASYVNVPQLWSFSKDTTGTANGSQKQDIRLNGLTAATNATNTKFTGNNSTFNLGSAGGGNYYAGEMAEVIYYLGGKITYAQENQIESYLAVKYGITLDQTTAQNYTASNGQVFWNATSNGVFNKNIFGVGIDNVSTLSQTQSQSINSNILTISNATGLTFYSFLMVSDSGSSLNLNQANGLPNMINAAVATVWRVSQTGSRCSANYILNSSTVNYGYYAPIASSMTPYMLIDSNADGIYETYLSATSTSGSNITFNAYLKDGARFTFGFKASIDYGDAWSVPTLTANNGAGHMIVPGVYLGTLIDAEVDGQPSVNALGDDTIGLADEDGINFNIGVPTNDNIVTMGSNTINVTASVPGYLNAWADFNQDGTYGGGSEYAIQNVHLNAGVNAVTFTVSDSVLYGPTSMRFRFDTINGDVTSATGLAKNGEVEDYKVYVTAPLVGPCTNGFQNPSFEAGPDPGTYLITDESNMPYWRTTATDHDIEQWYTGFNGVPAYNGSYFMELEANLYGALYQDVYTTPGTKLSWSFAHRGRLGNDTAQLKIGAPGATVYQATAIDGTSGWGLHSGYYTVPAGQYITRLEFWAIGSYGGNTSIGNFLDDVSVQSSFDYGDAPNSYGTYFSNNGPYHNITNNLYLGYGVTCDADGKPSAAANLDSLDDGITFPTACASCNTYTVTIKAFNNTGSQATIAGWIDFNKNGVFDPAERTSINIPSSASEQTVTMTFTVSAFSATSSSTYARFRIANDSTQLALPTGFASTGEVEDYLVPCVAIPTSIPSASPSPVCKGGTLSLTSTGTAPYYAWSGPNGFTSSAQDTTISSVPLADSGSYRVYAVYANGCEVDSAVTVIVHNCYINLTGNIFDDANGNGIIDGSDVTTDLSQTLYAVLADNTNTVLASSTIAANGGFSFSTIPAYTSGMTIVASTTNPTVGAASSGPAWPSNWSGTKENYGTNNLAGSGIDATPNLVAVKSGVTNITGVLLGFDQLPTANIKHYTIPYPSMNSKLALIPANYGLGWLAGSDPEDGIYTAGNTFTITGLSGMNGNTLYYDANGDGILQSYEQITGYTTITNFDPSKLFVKFTGAGSTSATFNYGSIDAANKPDPSPTTYTINWVGPLPVKLMYFNAEKLGETQSLLTWATASEINNAYFAVERSADTQDWDSIGQQVGAGTTDQQTNYSMIDAQPLPGVNYYRLKQVDINGNTDYSEIASVTFSGDASENVSTLKVYPNPLGQASKLNIALSSVTESINQVDITNEIGQIVYSTNLPQIQDYQVIGLSLPSGVYIVSVHTQNNNILTTRLVITH